MLNIFILNQVSIIDLTKKGYYNIEQKIFVFLIICINLFSYLKTDNFIKNVNFANFCLE